MRKKIKFNRPIIRVFIIAYLNFIIGPQPSFSQCVQSPLQCPNSNITYYLYTSKIKENSYEIAANDTDSMKNAPFISEQEIKILIHGYLGSKNDTPNKELVPEYLQREDEQLNIIVVDYGKLTIIGCAQETVSLLPSFSKCVAQFMNTLFAIRTDISPSRLHVVAYSLGCAVSIGLNKYLNIGKLPKMTLLDPVFSYFLENAVTPLYEDSANVSEFLEIYHASGGLLTDPLPFGDTDIFINGGSFQPLCSCRAVSLNHERTLCNSEGATLADAFCTHAIVASYYAASVDPSNVFWAHGVLNDYTEPEFNLIGEYINSSTRGLYFVDTSTEYPYALGKVDSLVQTTAYNVTNPRCNFASCLENWLLTDDGTNNTNYPTKQCIVPEKKYPNDNILYYLYNENTNDKPAILDPNQPECMKNAPFIANAPVKILLHDIAVSHINESSPNEIITKEYMRSSTSVNIISVEYLKLVELGCLLEAILNIDLISTCVAEFINTMLEYLADICSSSDIHVVGFGLGGTVALQMEKIKNGPLDRITALDPLNSVLYENIIPPIYKDGSGKANHVDVLHTDIGELGDITPTGDANYYSSGGSFQSSCNCRGTTSQDKICSHKKAQIYFAESINSEIGFWGHIVPRKVGTSPMWSLFGEHTDYSANGVYLFDVNDNSPYGQGKVSNTFNRSTNAELFPCGWGKVIDNALLSVINAN